MAKRKKTLWNYVSETNELKGGSLSETVIPSSFLYQKRMNWKVFNEEALTKEQELSIRNEWIESRYLLLEAVALSLSSIRNEWIERRLWSSTKWWWAQLYQKRMNWKWTGSPFPTSYIHTLYQKRMNWKMSPNQVSSHIFRIRNEWIESGFSLAISFNAIHVWTKRVSETNELKEVEPIGRRQSYFLYQKRMNWKCIKYEELAFATYIRVSETNELKVGILIPKDLRKRLSIRNEWIERNV
jgi:hypothetical protein